MESEYSIIDSTELFIDAVDEESLPGAIDSAFQTLTNLDKRIKTAFSAARKAKTNADFAQALSAEFGKKKAAIEGLQESNGTTAEAVLLMMEAQNISFEFQKELAKIATQLFKFGVSNLALNRATVREVTLRLQGASEEELSDLARAELSNVLRQLIAQQDILLKQQNLEAATKRHEKVLTDIQRELQQISLSDVQQNEIFSSVKQQLTQMLDVDREHDTILIELQKKLMQQNFTIKQANDTMDALNQQLTQVSV